MSDDTRPAADAAPDGLVGVSVYDLAHSKGVPAQVTQAMLAMQDRITADAAALAERDATIAGLRAVADPFMKEIDRLEKEYGFDRPDGQRAVFDDRINQFEEVPRRPAHCGRCFSECNEQGGWVMDFWRGWFWGLGLWCGFSLPCSIILIIYRSTHP